MTNPELIYGREYRFSGDNNIWTYDGTSDGEHWFSYQSKSRAIWGYTFYKNLTPAELSHAKIEEITNDPHN